jgi:hypothetical protein
MALEGFLPMDVSARTSTRNRKALAYFLRVDEQGEEGRRRLGVVGIEPAWVEIRDGVMQGRRLHQQIRAIARHLGTYVREAAGFGRLRQGRNRHSHRREPTQPRQGPASCAAPESGTGWV